MMKSELALLKSGFGVGVDLKIAWADTFGVVWNG